MVAVHGKLSLREVGLTGDAAMLLLLPRCEIPKHLQLRNPYDPIHDIES